MASIITDTRTASALMSSMVFIHRYAVIPANIHDSETLPCLLDPENEHDYVWADSAYSGEYFEDLLSLGGFESLIHEKGARNKTLTEASKELNRIKSAIRASVEHVFGRMTMAMWAGRRPERLSRRETRHGGGSKTSRTTSSDISSVLPVWLQLHHTEAKHRNLLIDLLNQTCTCAPMSA